MVSAYQQDCHDYRWGIGAKLLAGLILPLLLVNYYA
jgi:hypothetical protein